MLKQKVVDIRNGGLRFQTSRELQTRRHLQNQYTRNWVWRAVSALLDVSEVSPSTTWMAQRLAVPVGAVVQALEGLESLGIIRRTEKGYEKILKYVYFSDRDLDPVSVLSDHVLVSSQMLNQIKPMEAQQKSYYRTGFVATTESLAKEFALKVEVLMKEFLEDSQKAIKDRVVAFSFSQLRIDRKD